MCKQLLLSMFKRLRKVAGGRLSPIATDVGLAGAGVVSKRERRDGLGSRQEDVLGAQKCRSGSLHSGDVGERSVQHESAGNNMTLWIS